MTAAIPTETPRGSRRSLPTTTTRKRTSRTARRRTEPATSITRCGKSGGGSTIRRAGRRRRPGRGKLPGALQSLNWPRPHAGLFSLPPMPPKRGWVVGSR